MNQSHADIFRDYYYTNKGRLYKSFDININSFQQEYDIYWGDPEIIFDDKTRKNSSPLAVKIMPTRVNAPNPRIFIHEGLTQEHGNVFELVVTHEIGHLWLDDVVGLTRPSAKFYVDPIRAEAWADYFAYTYFRKYRDLNDLDVFCSIMRETGRVQSLLYHREPAVTLKGMDEKISELKNLNQSIKDGLAVKNPVFSQIAEAIEITLDSVGDIFY